MRGDVDGVAFDHLSAASSLLLSFVCGPNLRVPEEMQKLFVEYYVYTATCAMISIHPTCNTHGMFVPHLMAMAHQLLAEEYIGHLCGCWLQLPPYSSDFKIVSGAPTRATEPTFPSYDDFVTFGAL